MNLAILYGEPLLEPWTYAKEIGANSIHPNYRVATDSIIEQSERNGIPVRPYTVNKSKEMKRLLSAGTSAFITDYPERAMELRRQLSTT